MGLLFPKLCWHIVFTPSYYCKKPSWSDLAAEVKHTTCYNKHHQASVVGDFNIQVEVISVYCMEMKSIYIILRHHSNSSGMYMCWLNIHGVNSAHLHVDLSPLAPTPLRQDIKRVLRECLVVNRWASYCCGCSFGQGPTVTGVSELPESCVMYRTSSNDVLLACTIGDLSWLKRGLSNGIAPTAANKEVGYAVGGVAELVNCSQWWSPLW